MDNPRITVDDRLLKVAPDTLLLPALQAEGVDLPSLCYHPQLGQQGRCSLCVVEVRDQGAWRVDHACMIRCEPGMEIRTVSPRIHYLRSLAARMLLARGPFSEPAVEEMLKHLLAAADAAGIGGEFPDPQLSIDRGNEDSATAGTDPASRTMAPGCILCGRCISMCAKIGKNKLAFLGRGKQFRIGYVNSPSDTEACGACHACQLVCPTGYIQTNGQSAFYAKLYRT